MKSVYDVIIRPVITEQSMEDLDIKKYAFEVAKDANKIEIKKAIEEIFGVCDSVVTIFEGRLTAQLPITPELTREKVLACSLGGEP